MNTQIRKTLIIMVGIMLMEGWPMALILGNATPGQLQRFYSAPVGLFWPAWLAAIVVTLAYVLYSIRGLPLIGERFFDAHPLKLLAIPFALISGTMEELWFRRLGMDWVQGLGGNIIAQIAFSALTFGLAHGVWGLFARRWRVAVGSVLATTGLGAGLAIIYVLGNRHLAPAIWTHIAINLAIEPWLLMAAMQPLDRRTAAVD